MSDVDFEALSANLREVGKKSKGSVREVSSPDPYFSRAVKKALEILELLQAQNVPLGLSEITRRIGLTKASTFRLLRTLETSGYLLVHTNGTYEFIAEFASTVPSQLPMRLVKSATPKMVDVSRELRETISLALVFNNRSEVVSVVDGPEMIRMTNVVGHILPPNASSLGKTITAFQSDGRREKLLRSFGVYRFTEYTITDLADLNREFGLIRERGFAIDREETVLGGNCFGYPIVSPSGADVIAAVSMSVPKLRLGNIEREESIKVALSTLARSISASLT